MNSIGTYTRAPYTTTVLWGMLLLVSIQLIPTVKLLLETQQLKALLNEESRNPVTGNTRISNRLFCSI